MLDRAVYDEDAATLSLWFRGRGKYVYSGVPRAVFEALAAAQSAGRYFNEAIKGRFEGRFDPARRRFRPQA
ncbi:KTSC domain-containing protein [Sphingomonas jatrophae]|nr:KTSC domain-containing protein [Sphingomonas jatrophae]